MSRWLDPVRAALGDRARPLAVFFRNDDAGWDDARLFALLDRFEQASVPIDLAVIPRALGATAATELRARRDRAPERLGLHVHGLVHANHELGGRKSEFGAARGAVQQREDLEAAWRLLTAMLGEDALDRVFTPPWNRCNDGTLRVLRELGFTTISRDACAAANASAAAAGLREIPIHVDWQRCLQRAGMGLEGLGRVIGDAIGDAAEGPLGVMLHHATMDEDERAAIGALLALLATQSGVTCSRIGAIALADAGLR